MSACEVYSQYYLINTYKHVSCSATQFKWAEEINILFLIGTIETCSIQKKKRLLPLNLHTFVSNIWASAKVHTDQMLPILRLLSNPHVHGERAFSETSKNKKTVSWCKNLRFSCTSWFHLVSAISTASFWLKTLPNRAWINHSFEKEKHLGSNAGSAYL